MVLINTSRAPDPHLPSPPKSTKKNPCKSQRSLVAFYRQASIECQNFRSNKTASCYGHRSTKTHSYSGHGILSPKRLNARNINCNTRFLLPERSVKPRPRNLPLFLLPVSHHVKLVETHTQHPCYAQFSLACGCAGCRTSSVERSRCSMLKQ
ncbi:hypothetical protein GQ44DRAFT_711806 [Phaeosphaeriaceae sp. PMI808]|nr:hypothetical protein GQ44DRAFT_711806 [Phaeosphaeriaceae sp. PMI808]